MEKFILGLYILSFLFYSLSFLLRSKKAAKCAVYILSSGLLGNIYLIIRHLLHTHRLPLTNTYETLLSIITIIVFMYLVIDFKRRELKAAGLVISLISIIGLGLALLIFKRPAMPLLPALQSRWLVFHVSSCIIAYCFFTVAFIMAVLGLVKGKGAPLVVLRVVHRPACFGFFFLTLGIILGSVWGKAAWGHWWNWDPKEVWALITWLIYALYFYGCLFGNWSQRRLLWILVLGFSACLFTYLGVNFLLKGLHSYA